MEVYRIADHKKNRKLVYLEESAPAFCLYSKEISRFGLKEGEEIEPEVYGEIIELLTGRARERCLYLLEDMARTEYQLRRKLKEGFYPEEAIDAAVSYCRDRHYIDDLDYAERFVAAKSDGLSIRMIERRLTERGITAGIIEEVLEQSGISEEETVRGLIRKKYGDISGYGYEDRQKLIRKLLSRGFSYDSIKKACDNDDWNSGANMI